MRRGFSFAFIACLVLQTAVSAQSADRPLWESVAPPQIVTFASDAQNPAALVLSFVLELGPAGADKAEVELYNQSGSLLEKKVLGRTRLATKTVSFVPVSSGSYRVIVRAFRSGETVVKASADQTVDFLLPLKVPALSVKNSGGGSLTASWEPIPEATSYSLKWFKPGQGSSAATRDIVAIAGQSAYQTRLEGLEIGVVYTVEIRARRGGEERSSSLAKTVRSEAERDWRFTWFGQSSKAELNNMTMIDSDNLRFQLNSCSILPDGQIDQKGGKFTTFHDGLSYYYTVINPAEENFVLSATFKVDYINPTADGQEGFGLLAMDSLGLHTVNASNHYTNSAGIIATKFEETIAGTKKTSKDTLGSRFVTGLTPAMLAGGDSAIAAGGKNVSRAFSYDSSNLVRSGDSYRITLKKTNTGYHTLYESQSAAPGTPSEFTLYGPEALSVLDKNHVYVGFAAARGCNVTVSDVQFSTSKVASDPQALLPPDEIVPLDLRIDSPKTATGSEYSLVIKVNADGILWLEDDKRTSLLKAVAVKASEELRRTIKLESGFNDFNLQFQINQAFRPRPGAKIGTWDTELLTYAALTAPVVRQFSVVRHEYGQKSLYVAPDGSFLGTGAKDSPLDIHTALAFAKGGQDVILLDGVYNMDRPLIIERGNNGTSKLPKTLRADQNARPVLDFTYAKGGMAVWGDWWVIRGLWIKNTSGNIKGLQVAGNHNLVARVTTSSCGDTGLQISGDSTEAPSKWPSHNLILECISFDNFDPAANNADGFAAKLTCGEGNVFRHCIAYSNIDDGWDLFSKIETGPIGAVLIEDCVAFRNGSRLDGSGNGDGNGFKLGGDGIAVAHRLKNSIAWANGATGITSNSDPAVILENCTSYGNKQRNIQLYGKGDGKRDFKATGCISMQGGGADVYTEMPELASAGNYFWNGAQSINSLGAILTPAIFVSTDLGLMPKHRADGSIDTAGLLVLKATAPQASGARLR